MIVRSVGFGHELLRDSITSQDEDDASRPLGLLRVRVRKRTHRFISGILYWYRRISFPRPRNVTRMRLRAYACIGAYSFSGLS